MQGFLRTSGCLFLIVAATIGEDLRGQDRSEDAPPHTRRQELDDKYTVGPTAARELGYRIIWQADLGDDAQRFDVVEGDVYVITPGNRIARIDRKKGDVVWNAIAADPNDKIWGITQGMPGPGDLSWGRNADDKLYITTDPLVFVIDHASGSIIGRQPLDKVPSSEVVRSGPYLIYGTRTGQVIWHQYVVGHAWRANQLRGPVTHTPVLVGANRVACGSEGGTLLMLDGRTVGRIWGDQILGSVSAPVAAGDGLVFCASDDQYLRAYDVSNGRLQWKHLATSPLDQPPFFFDGGKSGPRILQWSEGEGLLCLEARSKTAIQGTVVWTLPDARGDTLGVIDGEVVLWDDDGKKLRMVDVDQGRITKTVALPEIIDIKLVDDSIYASGTDGRLIRLDPVR